MTAERCGTIPAPPLSDLQRRVQRERDAYAEALGEITLRYEQKVQELSLLRRTSDVLRDCSELSEVFRRMLAIVREDLGVDACSLYLADDSGDLLLRARCWGERPVEILAPEQAEAVRVAPGAGPFGLTFATGEVLMLAAVPPDIPGWVPDGAPVLLTAPLGPEGGWLGVLALHHGEAEGVLEDATRLLPILATQATIAIENAALYRRLKRHSDELEVLVHERTAALERANAKLQAAAGQRSQFFTHISHELRTPLGSILGFSEMLQMPVSGTLSARQQRYVKNIQESGKQLLRLITDILDLAKAEAGKLSLQIQSVPLPPSIEQALTVLQPQALGKNVALIASIPPGVPRVAADPNRLHQILLNLVSNAVKFTPEGGSVTVSAECLEGEGPRGDRSDAWIEISVADTGVGIAPEDQDRLFQDFAQASEGRYQGTGLGLSLTRRLVGLHGGDVGLVSASGKGSRFWFTLPRATAAPDLSRQEGG
jgi:signal transduction histidine kinase